MPGMPRTPFDPFFAVADPLTARAAFIDRSPSMAQNASMPFLVQLLAKEEEDLIPLLFGESDLMLDYVQINNEVVVIIQTADAEILKKSVVNTDCGEFMAQGSFLIAWKTPREDILSLIKNLVKI